MVYLLGAHSGVRLVGLLGELAELLCCLGVESSHFVDSFFNG